MPVSTKSHLYNTTKNLVSDRKLIYVIEVPDSKYYKGWVKVGDASEPTLELDNRPNSNDLREYALKRVKQYMNTAGLPFKICWAELAYNPNSGEFFRDYDVHNVLERSGYERGIGSNNPDDKSNEWFKVSPKIAIKAIHAVKMGQKSIKNIDSFQNNIIFRPEQKKIIKKTVKHFKHHNKKSNVMLWNAKMRFGKTLCALDVAKKMNYHRVLIVTHRPVVNQGWFDDFQKLLGNYKNYSYGSKDKGESLKYLKSHGHHYFYFASLQDLVGSKYANGKFNKDADIFDTKWDLLIIDEAHEGTQTQKAQAVDSNLIYSRKLLLSGTPFNLLNKYDSDQVCTWDYIMEQTAKQNWANDHNEESNPYSVLPKVSMYTFQMGVNFKSFVDPYTKTFNFDKFFKVDNNGKFHYEKNVEQFLNNITTYSSKTNYPYSTRLYRDRVRHSLWILPNRKSANALEKLMKKNRIFKDFDIVNVVKDNDNIYSSNDVNNVEDAIKSYDHTITLTVRKLTMGVTIPQWTAVVFLSDTSSAMQYLQAAFRAQSPYHNEQFKKTNCYIFDFSPERALDIATKTVQLDPSRHGKLLEKDQKSDLRKLLNFMPIIGVKGNRMKPYNINTLLQSLKKNYAERAVNTGFDDSSLYNDQLLLKLNKVDLKDFENLEAIVGVTKRNRQKNKVIINDQGLSKSEYDTANNGLDKSINNRTPEEQAAIEKMNKAKRERRTVISVLRSMSIRIPLMIYGMNIKFSDDISINDFTGLVDDKSWTEFMPKGVTKSIFNKFTKYYDPDVFIKAGKMIRAKVKSIDKLDPMTRTDEIAEIFSHFRNPDKETVLTPWRVVNMHLGKTLGGFSHYKDDYYIQLGNHWIKNSNKLFYNPNVHILEINSKTGLYPLYMVTSLYYLAFNKMDAESAGRFSYDDELNLWYKILRNNIFLIAKTPMAKQIAIRTLVGYKRPNVHIIYEENLVQKAKNNPDKEVSRIEERFNNMKFDVVIGNPPYQKDDSGNSEGASPIYQYFVNLSEKLSIRYVSLIIQARWFAGGKGLNKFRFNMLNDKHIKALYYFETPNDIFPHTEIKGGLVIFLWDLKYDNSQKGVRYVRISHRKKLDDTYRPLKTGNLSIFISDSDAISILGKIPYEKFSMESTVSSRKPFQLDSKFRDSKYFNDYNNGDSYYCYANAHKRLIHGYVNKRVFLHKLDSRGKGVRYINQWKIFTPHINAIGTDAPDDHFQTIIGAPNTICTETYMIIGYNLHLDKESTIHLAKYLKTKFSRYLMSVVKTSHNAPRKVYKLIPIQDFTNNSDIDWSKSISNIDDQLFNKYNLTIYERHTINKSIKDQA